MKKFLVLVCFVFLGSVVMAQTTDGSKSNPHQVKVEKIDLTQDVQPVSNATSTVGDAVPASDAGNSVKSSSKKSAKKCGPKDGAKCCAKKDGMTKAECKKKCSSAKKKSCKGHGDGAL